MANCYILSSSLLTLPEEKLDDARKILEKVTNHLEEDSEDGYVGYDASVIDNPANIHEAVGVWIRHNESINTSHVEILARTLLEELDLPEPFIFSWAYTCDAPRSDNFGGGACCVQKGKPTLWVDAVRELNFLRERRDKE